MRTPRQFPGRLVAAGQIECFPYLHDLLARLHLLLPVDGSVRADQSNREERPLGGSP